MEQGLTTTRNFNSGDAKVIDDRNAIDKLRLDNGPVNLIGLLRHNGIAHDPKIRKDDARILLHAAMQGGRKIQVPLPGGGEAPLVVPADQVAPEVINWGRSDEVQEPEMTPEDKALARVKELKGMKFLSLKKAAKDMGLECPGGMTEGEKHQLTMMIAKRENLL